MAVSANTQAILLLTAHFGKDESRGAKPLTPKEYGRFAEWLKSRSGSPDQLVTGLSGDLLGDWQDKTISRERILALLDRGSALALSLEKWLRAGLWVMTRSDSDYPRRFKQRLRGDSPAVLFGCGNRTLLNGGGLAVVGSRRVTDADLHYSRKVGESAASGGVSIVSGGARGVDETAMLGALDAEGTAIGVLADSLLRACSSAKYRSHLMANNLALVSPFNPEAGFNTGNAMQRNKYIYCLADVALAVHAGKTGGTWSGAQENLRKAWVPLWVKRTDDPEAGNTELIRAGGCEAPADAEVLSIESLLNKVGEQAKNERDLFHIGEQVVREPQFPEEDNTDPDDVNGKLDSGGSKQTPYEIPEEHIFSDIPETTTPPSGYPSDATLYEIFVAKVRDLCSDGARTIDELESALALSKGQLNVWLKQAVQDGELTRLTRPVRYEARNTSQGTLLLE